MELRPGRYRHFKGNEYELLYVARHSETLEPMVVYRALYGERGACGCVLPPCGASRWSGTAITAPVFSGSAGPRRGSDRLNKYFFKFFEKRGCFLRKAMVLYIS